MKTTFLTGRSVRAKAELNKAILDQGWFEFRRQLEYKMQWIGGQVLAIDPRNTSRTCPECGYVAADNRKTQAEFRAQWNFVLTFFKENEADGFSMTRMYRGAPFWTLSHDEYQTFQALINLIEASNRWGVEGCRKHINFVKLTKHPVTESGRGRLLSFYN